MGNLGKPVTGGPRQTHGFKNAAVLLGARFHSFVTPTREFLGVRQPNTLPLVFINVSSDLEDIMLFHVTANHDHMTCPARAGGRDSDEVRQALKWIEGNDDVKVLGVWISGPLHRVFTLLEASDFDAVSALLREQMLIGKAEVLPVSDAIAQRKPRGHWEL